MKALTLCIVACIPPDVQRIINPGGTENIPNALVLGAQMGLTF